jgi:hypothetical protein
VSATGTAPAPFLIIVAHGDGSESRIPASSYTELQALLGRMSEACETNGVPAPPTVVWRVDRGEPRPLSRAELAEGDLHNLPILAT